MPGMVRSASVSETAPVAEEQAHLFAALDVTFAAWASVARPYLQETISEGPETLDAAIAGCPPPPSPDPTRTATIASTAAAQM